MGVKPKYSPETPDGELKPRCLDLLVPIIVVVVVVVVARDL